MDSISELRELSLLHAPATIKRKPTKKPAEIDL